MLQERRAKVLASLCRRISRCTRRRCCPNQCLPEPFWAPSTSCGIRCSAYELSLPHAGRRQCGLTFPFSPVGPVPLTADADFFRELALRTVPSMR